MLCPKCHGKGWYWVLTDDRCRVMRECDCHAGQVSCCEGSERTGGIKDMEAEKRGAFKAAYVPWG